MIDLKRTKAAKLIEEHFAKIVGSKPNELVLVSGREAGRRMVEIYRLLTGEMPQAAGIEMEYLGDELPGVEFSSPASGDPNLIRCVYPGAENEPDVVTTGDQNEGEAKEKKLGKNSLCLSRPVRG